MVNGDATQQVAGQSKCLVIGNEGGFLTKPVAMPLNVPFNPVTLNGSLLMGPAERLDVVIDFSGQTGKSFILYTDTPAPFPVGDPVNDFLPNTTIRAVGPNTREILKITVVAATTAITPVQLPTNFTTAAGGAIERRCLERPAYLPDLRRERVSDGEPNGNRSTGPGR